MNGTHEIQPLDTQLRPAFDEEQIATTWQRIADARGRRTRRRRQLRFAVIPVLSLCAVAAIALVMLMRDPSDGPTTLAALDHDIAIDPGTELASVEQRNIALDDGSQIALAPQTRMQVLANDGRRFSTKLVRGTVDVNVQPGGPRKWEIETALATVEVVGTAFRVVHAEHSITVSVLHGVVVVRGERVPGRVQRLTAGEQLVVTEAITAQRETGSEPTATEPSTEQPELELDRTHTRRVDPPAPAVRPAAPAPRAQTLADVLAEVDRLRPRDPRAAATLIERALAKHPRDSSSGVAAFVLGKIYLESLGQPGRAAVVFRQIADRGSPHGLVEDARARLVEALVKHGDLASARDAFADYERRHPHGRWQATLRKLLAVP